MRKRTGVASAVIIVMMLSFSGCLEDNEEDDAGPDLELWGTYGEEEFDYLLIEESTVSGVNDRGIIVDVSNGTGSLDGEKIPIIGREVLISKRFLLYDSWPLGDSTSYAKITSGHLLSMKYWSHVHVGCVLTWLNLSDEEVLDCGRMDQCRYKKNDNGYRNEQRPLPVHLAVLLPIICI